MTDGEDHASRPCGSTVPGTPRAIATATVSAPPTDDDSAFPTNDGLASAIHPHDVRAAVKSCDGDEQAPLPGGTPSTDSNHAAPDTLTVASGTKRSPLPVPAGNGSSNADRSSEPHPRSDDPTRTRPPDADIHRQSTRPAIERLPGPLQFRDPQRYQIVAEHGRGGLGRVFRARDKELGRDVALKELLKRGTADELRFFREAIITARLEHPGIVPVHEAGRWPDGTPFYAMKLVAGQSLKQILERCTTIEDRLALVPNIIAVADAIAYAHDRHIIHRDLKPSNIIVGDYGETVVIDWGLAKDLSSTDQESSTRPSTSTDDVERSPTSVTITGSILGTPAYMAPEQARGERADERADVYAVGRILFELVEGATTDGSTRTVKVDPDLLAIARKATAIEPEQRYRNASLLSHDLHRFVRGARIARHYTPAEILTHWLRRRKWLAVTSATTAVLLATFSGIAVRSIIRERDRAETALTVAHSARLREEVERATAQRERDRATISASELFLEKDATLALSVAKQLPSTPETQLLRARIQGVGAAHWSVTLSTSKIVEAAIATPNAGPDILAFAANNHTISLFHSDTLATNVVARDAAEPAFLTSRGYDWFYVASSARGPELKRIDIQGRVSPIAHLAETPRILLVGEQGYFILTRAHELDFTPWIGTTKTLARDTAAITLFEHGVLACDHTGRLWRHTISGSHDIIGIDACSRDAKSGMLSSAGPYFSVAKRDAQVTTGADTHVSFPRPIIATVSSATGLVATMDDLGRGWTASTANPKPILSAREPSRATVLTAVGRYAAWGFADGTIVIQDDTGESWRFETSRGAVLWLFIDPVSRTLLSLTRNELRQWGLPADQPKHVATLPCKPFNLLSVAKHEAAADCADGTISVMNTVDGTVTSIHRHSNLAFSLASYRDEICSGSWDATLRCSDRRTGATRIAATLPGPIRWVAASPFNDFLVIAAAPHGVWLFDGQLRLLYEHEGEPYRVAVDATGTVASVSYDGAVASYNLSTKLFVSRLAHRGHATDIAFHGDSIITAGDDGTLVTWTTKLEERSRVRLGRVRLVHADPTSEYVSFVVNDSSLHVKSNLTTLARIDTGARIEAVASLGGIQVAGTETGELVILDLRVPTQARIASVPLFSSSIRALTIDREQIIAAQADGAILTTPLAGIPFVPFVNIPART